MTADVSEVSRLVAEAGEHIAAGNTEAAISALSTAGSANASYMPLHFVTALAAWQLGDTAKALALACGCHELDPMDGTVADVVASLYAQTGNLVESLYFGKLSTALGMNAVMAAWLPKSFPSFDEAFLTIQEKPLLAQARLLISNGKVVEALDKARQHVEVAPGDDEGRLFYGALLLRGGSGAAALDAMRPLMARESLPGSAASLVARALAAVGEASAARQWHDRACDAAPEDAAVAAARIADAPMLALGREQSARWKADWAARFLRPGKPRQWRAAGGTLAIGYLVPALRDPNDAAAVAAVARSHSRPGTRVIGYGTGAQSWDDNLRLRGAFYKWRDISGFDAATLAKTIAVDGLDVIIDVGGFAAPVGISALARVNTAVRAAWLCDATGLEGSIYDAAVTSRAQRPSATLAWWHPRQGAYPLSVGAQLRSRRATEHCRFGADAQIYQIDEPTAQLWRGVLEAAPGSVLLLRANDMAGGNVKRLVDRFGADVCHRIDVIDATMVEDFYAEIDIALTPADGVSPRAAAEALACGVPALAISGEGPYAAMMSYVGLATFIAATPDAYIALAARLAADAGERARAVTAAATLTDRAEDVALEIAAAIETGARAMLGAAAA